MSRLLIDSSELRAAGYNAASIEAIGRRNELVQRFLDSPLGEHLHSMEASDSERASGGTLLNVGAIKEEIEQMAPSALVFPLGFLPIWSSIGGNVVVYRIEDGSFYWADHEGFSSDGTMFLAGTNKEAEFDASNATQGMIFLSADPPGQFIADLRSGVYERRLDSLD